jgi:hypothetical protein
MELLATMPQRGQDVINANGLYTNGRLLIIARWRYTVRSKVIKFPPC